MFGEIRVSKKILSVVKIKPYLLFQGNWPLAAHSHVNCLMQSYMGYNLSSAKEEKNIGNKLES